MKELTQHDDITSSLVEAFKTTDRKFLKKFEVSTALLWLCVFVVVLCVFVVVLCVFVVVLCCVVLCFFFCLFGWWGSVNMMRGVPNALLTHV